MISAVYRGRKALHQAKKTSWSMPGDKDRGQKLVNLQRFGTVYVQ